MSTDMFASTQQTPVMKAPRTPSMTPTRSVTRRSCAENRRRYNRPVMSEPKKEARTCLSASQPVHTVCQDDFYDLRTRHVPLSNSMNDKEIWEQYGLHVPTPRYDSSHGSNQEDVRRRRSIEGINGRCIYLRKCSALLGLGAVMVLSGFIGAFCFAYFHHHLLDLPCLPRPLQISQDLQEGRPIDEMVSSLQLENSLTRLTEEVKHLKDHINKIQVLQENVGSEVIPSLRKGILEELLVADLACAGNLGSVLATPDTTTVTVPVTVTVLWFLSFNLRVNHRTPHTTIEGLIQEVGDCWGFEGSQGRLVLRLHRRSLVTAVSLSHIPPALSVSGDAASAPRRFKVLAHQHEHDLENGRVLGTFEYTTHGAWRQTFHLEPSDTQEELVDIIEFRFLENHGHPNYTCVYRVHVHGKPL